MAVKKLTPTLIVDDVLDTATFWCDVLEFRFLLGVPEGGEEPVFELKQRPLGFAMLDAGGVELMFQSLEGMLAELPNCGAAADPAGVNLFVEVDDVEAFRQRVDGRAEIFRDLADSFYGMREFCVRDPNGLLVIFAERLAEAD